MNKKPSGPKFDPIRWLIALHAGIALGFIGLFIKAALDGLLWRADFTAFYTGGIIVRQGLGRYLYNLALQTRVQQAILGPGRMFWDGVLPFNNPPHFALVMALFAFLPPAPAFWCWMALQAGLLVVVVRRLRVLTSDWTEREYRALVSTFGAFLPMLLQLLYGSLSLFVLLCLIGFYLALREGKEGRAGVWLALAAVKPQAMLFAALAVLGGRYWRVIITAGVTGLIIVGWTAAVLGPSIWLDYLQWLSATSGYFDRFGVYPEGMINLKGTLTRLLGVEQASLIQTVSGIALGGGALGVLILWAWRQWKPQQPIFNLWFSFTLTLGSLLSLHQNQQDCLMAVLPATLFYTYLRPRGPGAHTAAYFLLSWPIIFLIDEFLLQKALLVRLPVLLTLTLLIWTGWVGRKDEF